MIKMEKQKREKITPAEIYNGYPLDLAKELKISFGKMVELKRILKEKDAQECVPFSIEELRALVVRKYKKRNKVKKGNQSAEA